MKKKLFCKTMRFLNEIIPVKKGKNLHCVIAEASNARRGASVDDARMLEDARVLSRMGERGHDFRETAVAKNRPASCVRAMLLNIVLADRNVKPPRSGKARGSFREFFKQRLPRSLRLLSVTLFFSETSLSPF